MHVKLGRRKILFMEAHGILTSSLTSRPPLVRLLQVLRREGIPEPAGLSNLVA